MARDRLSLRSQVTTTLLLLGVSSVVALSAANYVVVKRLLDRSVAAQLSTLRNEQADAVRQGFEIVEASVAAIARDPAVVEAFVELADAYDAIDIELSDDQIGDLRDHIDETVLAPYESAGVDHPAAADLVAASPAGRYVQWRHVDGGVVADGAVVEDPGVASYERAHEAHADYLDEIVESGIADDLVLFSSRSSDVVFSTAERIDLGADLADGPLADSGLGRVAASLSSAAAGEPVVVDGSFYLPAVAAPTIFVAASVRTDTEVIGGIAIAVPTSVLTAITTAQQDWAALGLGTTGETYIVGSDGTLRTESRRWLEDPTGYLDRFESAGHPASTADLIRLTDSTVLLQSVENSVVERALDGDIVIGEVDSYLGNSTLAAASPIDVGGLQWAIVAEQATSETTDSLAQYRGTALLLLLVELPIIVAVGMLFARRVVRPIRPLVAYASDMSNGGDSVGPIDIGRDELGDIAHQLGEVSRELRSQEDQLAAEEDRITQMLTAVLPARLIERVRNGEVAIADIADTATVISVSMLDLPDLGAVEQEEAVDVIDGVNRRLSALAVQHGVERLHVSPDHQIFVAGLGSPDREIDRAMRFVVEVPAAVASASSETDLGVAVRIGVAAGDVATGMLGTSRPSFGVWGDPTGIAVALTATAAPGEIVVDRSVSSELDRSWRVEPREQVSVGDELIDSFTVHVPAAVEPTA